MGLFEITSLVIGLTAVFAYLNQRYVHLPTTVGVMAIAMASSLAILGIGHFAPPLRNLAAQVVGEIDFNRALFQGMLAFLLFAGALHLDLNVLRRQLLSVTLLAVVGTIVSTVLVGLLTWAVLEVIRFPLPLDYCMLFGALISPTDPIAVVGVMRRAGVSRDMEAQISGESLFNDGVGVVLFSILLEMIAHGGRPSVGGVAVLFLKESVGGGVVGLAMGYVTYRLLKRVDEYKVEVLLTLALAMCSYAVADALGLSGPIAVVVAGLLIANHGRMFGMSERTREHVDTFWELIDEVLNAVLFLLIGLEVLLLPRQWELLVAGCMCIAITLLVRLVSVAGVAGLLYKFRPLERGAVFVLTWGGLRGGLAVAMALSIPASRNQAAVVAITYAVVVFSILVQGLTVGKLVRRVRRDATG